MEFDFVKFFSVSVSGVPLILVVIGFVTYMKKFGVAGKALLAASLITGLVLGGGYQLAANGVPVAFAGWFAVIVYGLALGLFAAGVYDTGKNIAERALSKLMPGNEQYPEEPGKTP